MANTPETPDDDKNSQGATDNLGKVRENGGLFILGQALVFPKTEPGVWALAALCAGAVAFAWVVLHAPEKQLRIVADYILMSIDPHGKSKSEPDTINYGFWTPSPDTATVLQQAGDVLPDEWKWLGNKVEDADLIKFGDALRDTPGVQGYRRGAVWGQGRKVDNKKTTAIPGWWWTVRTKKEFTIEDLSKLYTEHWHSKSTLYVEVLGGAGDFK